MGGGGCTPLGGYCPVTYILESCHQTDVKLGEKTHEGLMCTVMQIFTLIIGDICPRAKNTYFSLSRTPLGPTVTYFSFCHGNAMHKYLCILSK